MNRTEWSDWFFLLKNIFVFKKKRNVESINKSDKNHNNYKKDNNHIDYKINKENNYYAKKRRNYSDYS